jgi:hypothetical protein
MDRFAYQARAAGATVIRLDCRNIEPTESGFLQALGDAIGGMGGDIDFLSMRLGSLPTPVILALDTVEVFRLLDTWLRQVFVPTLPDNVRLLLLGRQRPLCAWEAMPGWRQLMRSIAMTPLSEGEATQLLDRLGVDQAAAQQIVGIIHGHPLALKLAAAAVREDRQGHWLEEGPLQHALDLKAMMRRGGGRGEGSRVRFCVVWAKGTISREVVAMEVVLVAERGAARKRLRCWPGRGCGE